MAKTLDDLPTISGQWYAARFDARTRLLKIVAKASKFYMFVPVVAAVDRAGERDVHQSLGEVAVRRRGRTTVVTFTEKSSLWDRKRYTIEFGPRLIRYYYTVFGRGAVGRANFFHNWMSDPTTVETEQGVVPGYDTVFSPQVNFFGKAYYFAGDTATITPADDPSVWGTGLMGAPWCFALNDRGDKRWIWAGLGTRAGENTFETFTYNANLTKRIFGPGGFDCNYNEKLVVDGQWTSPHMILGASTGPYEAMADYVGVLEADYGLAMPRKRKTADWWHWPIFCGWGEQMSLGYRDFGNVEGVDANAYCTQARHDEWLAILRRHGIRPGQIIVDAGWEVPGTTGDMAVNTERWPDLRGWIEARRAEGIRTILWMCMWNRLGVPDEECIRNAAGAAVNVDPTNPAYEKRLRAMIRRLLSDAPGCLNGDGVKIDGEMMIPTGPALTNHATLWGLELQRRYLGIIRDEAKRHKKDALIGTFTAAPYLSDLSDVVRTADQFSIRGTPEDTMIHRARLLAITQPGCPIDTDHAYWYDIRDNWIDIMPAQAKVGIPCLYHAQYVWHKRPFVVPYIEEMTDAHYAVVAKVFDAYWKRLKRRGLAT